MRRLRFATLIFAAIAELVIPFCVHGSPSPYNPIRAWLRSNPTGPSTLADTNWGPVLWNVHVDHIPGVSSTISLRLNRQQKPSGKEPELQGVVLGYTGGEWQNLERESTYAGNILT